MFEYLVPAGWPDAGQLVEHGRRHLSAPQLAVVGVGEAVGLIPDAL